MTVTELAARVRTGRREPSPITSTSSSPPACCRSCGPAGCGRSTSATTGGRRAPSRSTGRRLARWRSSATSSPRPTSSGSRRNSQGAYATLRRARIPAERAEEFAARLDALSHEFISLPRDGDLEFGLLITLYPTTRLERAMTAVDDAHRTAPRPAVLQAVLGQRRVEPRRRRRHHRLSVVGVGGHPQPVARRPRHGRAAAAVAGVHTPRRRDHRSVDRRKAMVAMDLCRFALTLVVAFAVLGRQDASARPGRGRARSPAPRPAST